MQEQIEFDSVKTNDTATILGWLSRSFKVAEQWKQQGIEVYEEVGGDSDAARNRLASILRKYFVESKPTDEVVENWNNDRTAVEEFKVIAPKVTSSSAVHHDWAFYADYLLLGCASSDRWNAINQVREAEYLSLAMSHKIRTNVFNAVNLLTENPKLTDEQVKASLIQMNGDSEDESDKPAIAHVKEARRQIKSGTKIARPVKPVRAPLKPFESRYFA